LVNAVDAVGRLSDILDGLAAQGFDTRPLVVDSPASPGQVDAIEGRLGFTVPTSLRHVLTTVASRVEFAWFAPTADQSIRAVHVLHRDRHSHLHRPRPGSG
jgi:hypothetical protein